MNLLNKNTWRNLALAIFGATTLAACGGAGSCATCSTPTPNANLALTFNAPAAYPAGIAANIPVMVTNTSSVTASNVVYSIDATTNTTGGNITISPASQAACANLAAQQSCQLVAQIAASPISHPGAFSVVASSTSTQSTLNKVANFFELNATGSNLANASVGLVALPSNTQTGANGITLYYPTMAVAESGTNGTNIMVTAVVTSANAGSFNTINLVDGNGELLNFTVLTGNSGNELINLPVGSIVTFLVNIPQGSSQLQFQTQTATTTGGTSTPAGNPSTSPNSNTVTITPSVTSAGILNLLPNYFNLTTSYESQIITLTNTGNGELSIIVITPTAPLTKLSNNCAVTLAAGATCQYTVGFDKTQPIAGTSLVTVDYTSAGTPSSATATVNYAGRVTVAGLTITSGTNPNFDFTSRTAAGSESMTSQVTLKNTGSDAETLNSFTLPQNYFSLNTTGVTGTACTLGLVLAKDESCNINLVYTNGTVTSNTTTSIVVDYTYTLLGEIKTTSSSVGLSYQTLQSLASLTVSPATISFATPVLNNAYDSSVQTITISNNSDTDATNLDEVLSGTNSDLFNLGTKTSDCTATLAAHTSCTLDIQFGPLASSIGAGSKEASLDLSYNNASTTVNNNTPITAQAVAAQSAIITTAVTGNSGFTGAGTSGSPYSVNQNAAAPTVTITVSNSGTVPATDFYITPSSLGNWTLVNSNCGTSGSGVTLNATSGTCTFGLQLATATAGAQNYDLSNITMSWNDQDNPTGQTQNMAGTIYANVVSVTPPPSPASIAVRVVYSSWDNSQTGGTLTEPLLLHYIGNNLPMAFIDLTYTNTGNGAANNFTSTLATLPNGWTLRTHGCNAATLAATNGTCTDQYKFIAPQDIHATGTEFDNGNVKLSWNDGIPHESQVLTLPVGTAGVGGYNTANVIYNAVYLDMFVSSAAHNGQFSTVAGGNDAIANADILCTGDAQNTLVGTSYKALLVAESSTPTLANSRYACTTQACTVGESYNWVLQSNLRYSSLTNYNQIIGMTNASSIFPSGADINKIFVDSAKYIWTGLATIDATSQAQGYYNWMTTYPGFTDGPQISPITPTTRGNCNNWTSNTAYDNLHPDFLAAGNSGRGNQSGYNAFALSSQGCNDNGNKHYLLCVQQPSAD